jgi:hypothetical protein
MAPTRRFYTQCRFRFRAPRRDTWNLSRVIRPSPCASGSIDGVGSDLQPFRMSDLEVGGPERQLEPARLLATATRHLAACRMKPGRVDADVVHEPIREAH